MEMVLVILPWAVLVAALGAIAITLIRARAGRPGRYGGDDLSDRDAGPRPSGPGEDRPGQHSQASVVGALDGSPGGLKGRALSLRETRLRRDVDGAR